MRELLLTIVVAVSIIEGFLPIAFAEEGGQAAGGQVAVQSIEMPKQLKQPGELRFRQPSFTMVRVQYTDDRGAPYWRMDYPESDLKFSKRVEAVTGLKTSEPKSLRMTETELKNYPFLYMVEGGRVRLDDQEVVALRTYLHGGGFLLVDDFWGDAEWESFAGQLKRVFPDREPKELDINHPIFHSLYDLKEQPQVLHIVEAMQRQSRTAAGLRDDDKESARYVGIMDDAGRLMVLLCHNTDLGDGWERDGYDEFYSREYSQKRAYPMGINIVVHVLTQEGPK